MIYSTVLVSHLKIHQKKVGKSLNGEKKEKVLGFKDLFVHAWQAFLAPQIFPL
jgi:hypothetical protein